MSNSAQLLKQALWRLYNRPSRPLPWGYGGNLPWDDPDFSERMLREHLDDSHGAASRTAAERERQLDWLWSHLQLAAGHHILDVTCGLGLYAVELAQRGCFVTGIDFGPASIRHARQLAEQRSVTDRCHFIEADIRGYSYPLEAFDAAILLYGQLAVMSQPEAQRVLEEVAAALKPGATLCLELLDAEHVDRTDSSWWYTDQQGLWGSAPFLHLGERQWIVEERTSVERYFIVHLETGRMDEVTLSDRVYERPEMTSMLQEAGFSQVKVVPGWSPAELYDGHEWLVYLATRAN